MSTENFKTLNKLSELETSGIEKSKNIEKTFKK